jgi:hypothetical protein
MQYADDDDDTIALGVDQEGFDDDADLGPDERDMDLMDGSWEAGYYGGQHRTRDWHAVYVGLALLALLGITIPVLGFLLQ